MTYKELMYLDKLVKATKTKLFIITPNGVMGTDDMTTLSVINAATGADKLYEFERSIWDSMIKDCGESQKKDQLDFNKVMDKLYAIKRIGIVPVLDIYNRTLFTMQSAGEPKIIMDDIKEDAEFARLLTLKAADGMQFYRFSPKYILSMWGGLLPVVKKDKIDMKLYDVPNAEDPKKPSVFFISEFVIHKGFADVHKFIQYTILS